MKQIIAVLTAILMTLTPALAEPAPSRTLDYFWFTHGGELPSQSYEITETDGEFILTRDDDATAQIDSAVLDALMDIIDACDVAVWDGFHESEPYVLDGETFSLSVRFSDGAEVQASGDNRFPDRYHDFSSAVTRLLDTVLDGELTGTYRYEGNGVGGDFTITFEEDGTYTFYEGSLSSYLGGGRWFSERALVYLNEKNGMELQFYFQHDGDTLSFLEAYSDAFPYVEVPDGGKFIKVEAPEDQRIIVGKSVALDEITDFYYTIDASYFPPHYQRYRFYMEDGAYWFFHETREGGGWPQTEEDITVSGVIQLTEAEWAAFFELIAGGEVRDREENLEDGDAGPWTYLYWKGDQGTCQEYTFASYGARLDFEAFCEELASREN